MVKHSRDIAVISGIVYFTQGSLGLSGVALPLFLRGLKWSVGEITAVTSFAALPWVFKILYGLVSDTFPLLGYRRKSYLVLFSLVAASGWIALVALEPGKTHILIALILSNLGFAATDVITDGLVVEHSTSFTSPIYQAIAWGSRSLGAVASGFAGGWLASRWPAQQIFLLTALLPLTVTFVVVWIHEHKITGAYFLRPDVSIRRCASVLGSRNLLAFSAILFLISVSSAIGLPFFFHMKEILGFHETFLGFLSSLGWSGAVAGSMIYARWLRHIGAKTTLRYAIFLNSLNILSTLFIAGHRSAFLLVFFGGVLGCLVMLPIMSSAARLTHHTGVEGTLFAILMSIFNLGQIFFGYVGGQVYHRIGLYPLIAVAGTAALTGLVFVEKLRLEQVP